jgi:hydrogenase small subunit
MHLTRRDFLKGSSAVAAALGLNFAGIEGFRKALAAEGSLAVVWLQGQGCNGCSVSLLNSVYYATIDAVLTKTIDLNYHPTVMAAAGDLAVKAAMDTLATNKYVLVVEGAVPINANGQYCYAWPGMTIQNAVKTFAQNTSFILAVGSCATYGGVSAGTPNPTGARGVQTIVGTGKKVVNIPGCPANPDWIVGTIAYMIQNGKAPALDAQGRPTDFFGKTVHSTCPNLPAYTSGTYARALGNPGCLRLLGCRGPETYCDCPTRGWNGAAANTPGVNWCVKAGAPCHACTEPGFPDKFSAFYKWGLSTPYGIPPSQNHNSGQACSKCHGTGSTGGGGSGGGTVACSQCHSDGRTGSLPAGHPSISGGSTGGTGGTGGGTTTAVNCARCHSDGRTGNPPGTLPSGHPAVSSSGSGSSSGGDDGENDD